MVDSSSAVGLQDSDPLVEIVQAALGYEDAVLAAIAEGHLSGALYSVFGEDFDLRAMPRSSELRCYMAGVLLPPPFPYGFELRFALDRVPTDIRTQITTDLATKVAEIIDYSRKSTGLTISPPEGYAGMDDFMDIARIYLTRIFGKSECRRALELVAESTSIVDDDRLKISRFPKAELVLATYLLQQALVSGALLEFYILPNDNNLALSNSPSEFSGPGNRYVTDVDLLRIPATTLDLLIPLFAQKFRRVVAQNDVRQSSLEGKTPLAHVDGFYQLQELRI